MTLRVALYSPDQTRFPNLALMKLSAFWKAAGADVYLAANADEANACNVIQASKVFTFTPAEDGLTGHVERGGTGYGPGPDLPDHVEHLRPDYSLYGLDYSVGFVTRGCIRKCEWCVVPSKEGAIRAHADLEEFAAHRDVVLLDNNILAHPHGLGQIERAVVLGHRLDVNQGLDCRLIDAPMARLLGRVSWRSPLRLACDHVGMLPALRRAVETLRWHNVTPSRYFVYVLVREIGDALERLRALKGMSLDPFAQPFIPPDGTPPTAQQRALARWVNHKAEFRSRCWEDYAAAHGVPAR